MQNRFIHEHRVTYADCTVGNHVYYGRYLDVLESARGAFFRHAGIPFLQLQQQEIIFPVVECHLRYKAAARYDDILAVSVWPALVERVRLNFGYRIDRGDTLILTGETHHVCTGLDEKPRRILPAVMAALNPFLKQNVD